MAGNEDFDLDKDSQLFPQNDTEGSADDSSDKADDPKPDSSNPDAGGGDADPELDGEPDKGETKGKESEPKPAEAPKEFDPTALTVPDGLVPDQELLQQFGDLAKDMNMSQEQAQELVDLQVKAIQAQEAQFVEMRRQWVDELKKDQEYGGTRFDATVSDAQAVMRRFDPSGEVLQVLQTSGFGDNPAVIKMLAKIRRSISDDEFVTTSEKATDKKSLNERLWPDEVMGV